VEERRKRRTYQASLLDIVGRGRDLLGGKEGGPIDRHPNMGSQDTALLHCHR